jgi:hypothetical protein
MKEPQDPLDALLREQNTYLEDAGFTARVVKSLPRRRTRRWGQTFLLGVSVIGWIAAACGLPWNNLPPLDTATLISLNSQELLPWLTVSLVIACLTWSTVTAVQWDD